MLDTSYVGSKGTHLLITRDINQPIASAPVALGQINPNAVRPYPGFASISTYESTGNSIYHSWQTSPRQKIRWKLLGAGFLYLEQADR